MTKKKTKKDKVHKIGVYRVNDLAPRPVEITPIRAELIDSALIWIQSGKTLRDWCRLDGHPKWHAIYEWIRLHPDLKERFREAREAGMDAIAEETLAMVDEYPERIQGDRIDPGWVQWKRMQVEQRIKLMAKWYPTKYGDKVGVEHKGGVSLSVVTGVPMPPAQAVIKEVDPEPVKQVENNDNQD